MALCMGCLCVASTGDDNLAFVLGAAGIVLSFMLYYKANDKEDGTQ